MRKLELVGLDADGRQIVLVDESGTQYAVSADERLRAALRGDRARLGQLEIDMDSALRPRDIQARIRAGDSPEAVAAAAQVSVDRIMSYCVPVLAERRHVADLARRHHVRRKNTDGPARTLDAVVGDRLRSRNIEPSAAAWDAWRRDDGRWTVRTTYHSGERERAAEFVFDMVGRYSLADDDEAKWLTGEKQSTRKGPQPREGGRDSERRLSAVRDDDDLLSLSDDFADEDETDDLTAVVRAVSEPQEAPLEVRGTATSVPAASQPDFAPAASPEEAREPAAVADSSDVPAAADDEPAVRSEVRDDQSPMEAHVINEGRLHSAATPEAPTESVVEPASERRRRSSRRASVPSWDEIMFGKGGE